jgi:putative ABC transport system permease protein
MRIHLTSLHEQMVGPVRTALLVLLAAVGFVLLIACANVANLMLARATGRQKDIAVRAALGAGRSRLVREMLSESFVLASFGGVLGCAVAYWTVRLLVAMSPGSIPRLEEATMDLPVLFFALGTVFITTLLCGLAPALKTSGVELVL